MPKLAKNLLSKMTSNKDKEKSSLLSSLNESSSSNNDSTNKTTTTTRTKTENNNQTSISTVNVNQLIIDLNNKDDKKSNSSSIVGDDVTTNSSNAEDLDLSSNDINKINKNSNKNQDDDKQEHLSAVKLLNKTDDIDSSMNLTSESKENTTTTTTTTKSKAVKTKSDIEILDDKITKCKFEITVFKQKLQNEWSKHMNKHMNNFYANDLNKKNEHINDNQESANNTKPLIVESNQIEKNIRVLNKKLQNYEKRKEKLLKQQQEQREKQISNDLDSASSSNCSNHIPNVDNNSVIANVSTFTTTTTTTTTQASSAVNTNGDNPTQTFKTKSLNRRETQPNFNNNLATSRSLSNEDLLNSSKLSNQLPVNQQQQSQPQPQQQNFNLLNAQNQQSNGRMFHNYSTSILGALVTHNEESPSYIQPPASASATSTNTNQANVQFHINNDYDDNSAAAAAANAQNIYVKAQLQRELPILFQFEQEFNYLKDQQSKLQSDVDDVQKKMNENADLIIKEIKHNYNQVCEPVRNIAINLLKSNDQKLEDFKNSMKTSIESLEYKLSRNYNEIKEDIAAIKSRIDSLEKSQKTQVNNFENATDYYQIFTKIIDIILTLCAIFLLVLNHTASIIKYIFSSYPRCIMFLLFLYAIIYNYFKYDHFSFIHKYFENLNNINTTSLNGNSKLNSSFFLFNNVFFSKINQLFNIICEYLFKSTS